MPGSTAVQGTVMRRFATQRLIASSAPAIEALLVFLLTGTLAVARAVPPSSAAELIYGLGLITSPLNNEARKSRCLI